MDSSASISGGRPLPVAACRRMHVFGTWGHAFCLLIHLNACMSVLVSRKRVDLGARVKRKRVDLGHVRGVTLV
jgi:hypothetical protein